MKASPTSSLLRQLPSVDKLLQEGAAEEIARKTSHERVRDWLRSIVDEIREEILRHAVWESEAELRSEILGRLAGRYEQSVRPRLRRVINATGVIVHTNLGRAPLSEAAIEAVGRTARYYTNLEYDLAAGVRGKRDRLIENLITGMTGAERAIVVNNNAAAVLLALNTLAFGYEVIVSRGELVEIGGGFRVPEVMQKSGAILREVGTTNKTRAADYRNALSAETRAVLRVHPSNFRIEGFTERPSLEALAEVAQSAGIPLYEDLGSGCLIPLGAYGLTGESPARDSLLAGADVISFSGDKLLGGPQCGVLAGKQQYIDAMRSNPLMRALRADKMTYAALEATLRSYADGRAAADVPVVRMLAASKDEIRRRAEAFAPCLIEQCESKISAQLLDGESVAGGGAAPGQTLPTTLIAITHRDVSAGELLTRLRASDPPVIARIEDDRLVLDLRTVDPSDEQALIDTFFKAS